MGACDSKYRDDALRAVLRRDSQRRPAQLQPHGHHHPAVGVPQTLGRPGHSTDNVEEPQQAYRRSLQPGRDHVGDDRGRVRRTTHQAGFDQYSAANGHKHVDDDRGRCGMAQADSCWCGVCHAGRYLSAFWQRTRIGSSHSRRRSCSGSHADRGTPRHVVQPHHAPPWRRPSEIRIRHQC